MPNRGYEPVPASQPLTNILLIFGKNIPFQISGTGIAYSRCCEKFFIFSHSSSASKKRRLISFSLAIKTNPLTMICQ